MQTQTNSHAMTVSIYSLVLMIDIPELRRINNNSYGKGRLAAKYAPASSLHFRSVGRPYYPLFNLKPNT